MCQLVLTEVNYPGHDPRQQAITTASSPFEPIPDEPIVRNLNIGFAVDFKSENCDQMQSLQTAEGNLEHLNLQQVQLQALGSCNNVSIEGDLQQLEGTDIDQQIFDTFEQCLQMSNQQDSVMAYYYKYEDDQSCYNFEEIYDVNTDNSVVPGLSFSSLNKSRSRSGSIRVPVVGPGISMPQLTGSRSHSGSVMNVVPGTSTPQLSGSRSGSKTTWESYMPKIELELDEHIHNHLPHSATRSRSWSS